MADRAYERTPHGDQEAESRGDGGGRFGDNDATLKDTSSYSMVRIYHSLLNCFPIVGHLFVSVFGPLFGSSYDLSIMSLRYKHLWINPLTNQVPHDPTTFQSPTVGLAQGDQGFNIQRLHIQTTRGAQRNNFERTEEKTTSEGCSCRHRIQCLLHC